ncbi:MAG: hypothetical protein R3C99_02960 [Pirellulaceae bacterium]
MKSRLGEVALSAGVLAVLGAVLWTTKSNFPKQLMSPASASAEVEDVEPPGIVDDEYAAVAQSVEELRESPAYLAVEQSFDQLRAARAAMLKQMNASSAESAEMNATLDAYRVAAEEAQASCRKLRGLVTAEQWRFMQRRFKRQLWDLEDGSDWAVELKLPEGAF